LYKFDVESELAEYAFPMPANLEEPKKAQANEQYSIRKGASAMFSKQDRSKSSISKSFNQNMTSQDSPHKESEFEDEKNRR